MVNAPGDLERLAGRDVRLDLGVADVREVHRGGRAADHLAPGRAAITQWPVCSTPVRPRIDRQRAAASSASPGLPRIAPSRLEHRVAADHQPASGDRRAGDAPRALSRASSAASVGRVGRARDHDSSTPETTTSGSSPAARSVASRAGDALARTSRVTRCGRAPPAAGRGRASRGRARRGGTP